MAVAETALTATRQAGTRAAAIVTIGRLLVLFSLTMLPPFFVGLLYRDGATTPFLYTFLLTISVGLGCWLSTRSRNLDLRKRQGFLVVVGFWLTASLLCAIPFMLAEHPHMHFTDAVFEATSGLTTTGATVLSNLEGLPHSILYYRAQLNFLGGLGVIVLAVAILPLLGIGGMQLYRAETPGPMKEEKLTPRIRETARHLWFVYVGLAIACAVSYWLAGMGVFDAVAHSFSTLSLGGFSTHNDSIGFFHSPAIEVVGGVFSLLAGVNYALYYLAWRQGSLMPILRNAEFLLYAAVMALIITVTCLMLWVSGTFGPRESVYHGFFQAVSIATTNGLTTGGYPGWPPAIALLLVFGSFFGGSVGTSCGGIKAFRFLLLFRQSVREVRLLIHPAAQIAVKVGGKPLSERVVESVWGFYFLYIFAYCMLSLGVAMSGVDLVTAFGSVAACLNDMGVGLGETASSFGGLNDSAKWMLWLAMLLGRLEVFPLLLLFSREFWQ
jgi:trk/ktr system potassium uptake protein